MQTEVIRMNRTPEYRLRDHRVREELLSKANSLLGILNQTRSYNIKRRLFANSILYKFAYGDKYMQKFVLYGEKESRITPPAETDRPSDFPLYSVHQELFPQDYMPLGYIPQAIISQVDDELNRYKQI